MSKLNEFHEQNWKRMHEAFAPPHGRAALLACIGEEVGELCAAILGVTGEKKRKVHLTRDDVLGACANAATYISLCLYLMGHRDLDALLAFTADNWLVQDRDSLTLVSRIQEQLGGACFSIRVGGNEAAAEYLARCYLTLVMVAGKYGCADWHKLLGDTFNMVSERAGSSIRTELGQS